MRIAYYTDSISEHQLPVVFELIKRYGSDSVRYFYVNDRAAHRKAMMGSDAVKYPWTRRISESKQEFEEWSENAEVLYTIFREPDMFNRRIAKGLRTLYMSERWFKPPMGLLRILHPVYFSRARKIRACLKSGLVTYLPTGVVAATDMARMDAILSGHWLRALCLRHVSFERRSGGTINGYPWMRMWGYFVSGGPESHTARKLMHKPLRVLWVGRYLALKRVETIIKAVRSLSNVELDLYGAGDKEKELRQEAQGCERVTFHGTISLQEVRAQMRSHDVYVMSSNGFDGWGAVVSEAIEEGMMVLGTFECGGPATLLLDNNLFHVGDWRELSRKLAQISAAADGQGCPQFVSNKGWSAKDAAEAFIEMSKGACE